MDPGSHRSTATSLNGEAAIRVRIERNLMEVKRRIAQAANRVGRHPDTVRLVAVTKEVGTTESQILWSLGVKDFGENRVEIAVPKIGTVDCGARWHMIGSVQRRKARELVAAFDVVDSVDRLELAETLERRCEELDKSLPVLLEVNVSGESAKHGFSPRDVESALRHIVDFSHLRVEGLMTMAPFAVEAESIRPVFSELRELAQRLGLRELSMGMTNDFEVAIEEGATQVRIGTALFE